ncbi:hypothetical protein [Wenjunlia tyrosinilytica]|uniref:Uncharacterized protein n=1 Tax=Wenjunlia tyrosinilytica TaxID=1544741 RepID=A0A917ZVK8_9ACTN|nr:hypothetical protein [Wenjunlia tyrosinilytica]GGO96473.1 hypothetical protein GCM10012280_56040 [Wenjunlia tyrosinilytica]
MLTPTPHTWPASWEQEILLITCGTNGLGPDNSLIKALLKGDGPTQPFADASKELVVSLLDPALPASHAKAVLLRLCYAVADNKRLQAIPDEVKTNGSFVPPGLNVANYTAVLELIAAKALWLAGHQQFLPWPFNETKLKPDFCIAGHSPDASGHTAGTFYDKCSLVGDSLKVSGVKTLAELPTGLLGGVTEKLAAYPTKDVIVVLDACDNPCLWAGQHVAQFDRAAVMRDFATQVAGLRNEVKKRLVSVYVILPDWSVNQLVVQQ